MAEQDKRTINKDINNKNKKSMQQTTRQRRGRPWQWLQVMTLMLVMLTAGISPAWALQYAKDVDDKGGGKYNFVSNGNESWDFYSRAYFRTVQQFDPEADSFFWRFDVVVNYYGLPQLQNNGYFYLNRQELNGEVILVTGDNVKHKIATWQKKYGNIYDLKMENQNPAISYEVLDTRWGTVNVSEIRTSKWEIDSGDDNTVFKYIYVDYSPSSQAIADGIKSIILHEKIKTNNSVTEREIGDATYTKNIDIKDLSTDSPMPKPTIEWGDDGKVSFKATGVPDKRSSDKVASQGYAVTLHYYENGVHSSNATVTAKDNGVTLSNVKDGKMDMVFGYWPLTTSEAYAKAAYTVPVYVDYHGYLKLKKDGNIVPEGHTLSQPTVEGEFIKPFTRPTDLSVDFDRWGKKNTVKWKRQTKVKGYDGSKEVDVECRYKEGKWHVLRYVKGQDPSTYKEIATPLAGDETKLEVTDTNFDYDKEYVYRVVFLPNDIGEQVRQQVDAAARPQQRHEGHGLRPVERGGGGHPSGPAHHADAGHERHREGVAEVAVQRPRERADVVCGVQAAEREDVARDDGNHRRGSQPDGGLGQVQRLGVRRRDLPHQDQGERLIRL